MKTNSKFWIIGFLILVIGTLSLIGIWVVKVDPFFHYHAPDTDAYFYLLNSPRNQNDGISKHFEYDAMITGTSMVQNFKPSEMDEIFGTTSIKIPYSGGSYKEVNDNLINALNSNADLRIIVRGLDMDLFLGHKDDMRTDLGEYPTYLYDDNIFNDVKYLFNRDVVFARVYVMTADADFDHFSPGITSFDTYTNWMEGSKFGIDAVRPQMGGINTQEAGAAVHLTDDEKQIISENIYQNVTSLAEAHPEVTFYYFITPYSAVWWKAHVNDGTIYRQVEAEKYIIETLLQTDNIKLYSFNNRTDITTDLNNYKERTHYGAWINSLILRWMHDEKYLLTWDNYEEYIRQELSFYTSYDYSQLANQEDYENDYYAGALLNEELSGVSPIKYTQDIIRYSNSGEGVELSLEVDDIGKYKYLVFYGEKKSEQEWPTASIYNESGEQTKKIRANYYDTDDEWHQYLIDVTQIEGAVTIILDGDYSDIVLY